MRTIITATLMGLFVFTSSAGITVPSGEGPLGEGPLQQVIVVFDDDVADPAAAASELVATHRGQVGLVYRHALKGFSATLPAPAVAAIQRDPRVASVELDQVVRLYAQTIPTGIQRIFADGDQTINGSDDLRVNVDVAVIDTGIDLDHPDLNVVASTNCSGGSPFKQSCGSGGDDDNGHGTHVAGTIGALDNGQGVVGVASGARLWSVKVLRSDGSGYLSWIIAGVDYVTANAASIEVANMSLGGEFISSALNTAIANSVKAGVAYAVAAGNSDEDAATHSPANHPDVLTVSALADFNGLPGGGAAATCRNDQDDTLADFSNWGSLIEITAPGVCILSTWLSGGYNTISGTSMASPHAAGALALLASNSNPNDAAAVKALYDTVELKGNLDWTDDSGDGIKERLLDVSSAVFAPATVAGSGGGGGGTNTAPTAAPVTTSTNEDTAKAIGLSGTDVETCELTFSIVSGPSNGSLGVIADSGCVIGTPNSDSASVTYTPNANYNGSDSFTYRVSDGSATGDAMVTVTVNAVNDAPVASNDSAGTQVNTAVIVNVLANDSDVDGNALTVTNLTQPANGTAALNSDNTVTYTPASDFTGTDSFTYTANDGLVDSNTATVTITVGSPTTMHVGDLDGSSSNNGSTWTAVVTVLVVDTAGNPVDGAVVSGDWTVNGTTSSGGCTTGTAGTCSVSKASILKRIGSVSYTVTGVSGTLTYVAGNNTDPDGDSNGTLITVFKS